MLKKLGNVRNRAGVRVGGKQFSTEGKTINRSAARDDHANEDQFDDRTSNACPLEKRLSLVEPVHRQFVRKVAAKVFIWLVAHGRAFVRVRRRESCVIGSPRSSGEGCCATSSGADNNNRAAAGAAIREVPRP